MVVCYQIGWVWGERWEPLLADFILLGQKLENLGFTYYNGQVVITEPIGDQ